MKNAELARPRIKLIARLFVVPALLLAGYAGMQLAPLVHLGASSANHSQLAIDCPSNGLHC
jgi:hypothetical protein